MARAKVKSLTKTEKLAKAFPDAELKTAEVFFINKKLYVTAKYLEGHFDVSTRMIANYRERGMEISEFSISQLNLYNLQNSIDWYENNIDKSNTKRTKKGDVEEESDEANGTNVDDIDLGKATYAQSDQVKKAEEAKQARIKTAEMMGKLISSDDIDKVSAELGAIHMANYQNDIKVLPSLLENKKKEDIDAFLQKHFKDRIGNVDRFLEREFDMDITIYDIFISFMELIDDGVEVSEILENLLKDNEDVE